MCSLRGWGVEMVDKICNEYKLNKEDVLRVVDLVDEVKVKKEEKEKKVKKEKVKKVKKEKVKKEKKVKSKYPMPFVGVVDEENCCGIKFNGGLHTQCDAKKKNGDYCGRCHKQTEKNANGKPSYGDIRDRLSCGLLEYRDPKGKMTVPLANVMKKKGWSREEVEEEAKRMGVEIPDEHWVERKSSRGRPKKVAVSDTESESVISEKPKKRRGRPKKVVDMGESAVDSDLLLSALDKETSVTSSVEEKVEKVVEMMKEMTMDEGGVTESKETTDEFSGCADPESAKKEAELELEESGDEEWTEEQLTECDINGVSYYIDDENRILTTEMVHVGNVIDGEPLMFDDDSDDESVIEY